MKRLHNLRVALVGNPNCGKSTIFNSLTGANQQVGNWPGVTVERKSGFFIENKTRVEVIDLPGIYSLTVISEDASIDARIASEYVLNKNMDVVVNVLDASNLERHFYLTLQLLEMGIPVIVAVNMMDLARNRHYKIKLKELEKILTCPVVSLEANKKIGINELKKIIAQNNLSPNIKFDYPDSIQQALKNITVHTHSYFSSLRLLEDDVLIKQAINADVKKELIQWQQRIAQETNEDADILIADVKYRFIENLLSQCLMKNLNTTTTVTSRIDNIVLNRFLGLPIFLLVMYCMFFFAINIGGAFQDFFDISGDTIFVGGIEQVLLSIHAPAWLIALLANGIGKGITTTLTFIPVIGAMFFFLAVLESSGYMARAAFVVDRFMRMLGLPGKSFVPMIIGFGCNVPSVMSARTLENKRDRILTVMMSPFMSCGARLAIYAVFTAAFFPTGGQNIVFLLYLIGIIAAVLTGFMLRKTILQGDAAPLVMELPTYHLPSIKTILFQAWERLKGFVLRAGKLIVPICLFIGALNSLNMDGTLNTGEGDGHSLLSFIGQLLTPIFSPMGIQNDNWPATVGLITGVLAKEVVVGSLNTLYSQMGHFANLQAASGFDFWAGIQSALASIPENLSHLGASLSNPVLAKAPVHTLSQNVYGLMYQRFDGKVGAIAYLLFVLLYFPCISTTAVMFKEVGKGWAWFSVFWTTGVAYCTAVSFYQIATWLDHPVISSLWIFAIVSLITLIILSIRTYADMSKRGAYEFS